MTPPRSPANGVPWLVWLAGRAWECLGCGATGTQPDPAGAVSLARWAGDTKRAHAGCGPPVVLSEGEVGHPLNPDRAETGSPSRGG